MPGPGATKAPGLSQERPDDQRDGDRDREPRPGENAKGTPLACSRARLGRIRIRRRSRLARNVVLAFEDLRLVLDLALRGHTAVVPVGADTETPSRSWGEAKAPPTRSARLAALDDA
jgi:hypothetical protein